MRARLIAACVLGLVALPARAGLFDDEEARARIEDTRGRIEKLRGEFDELVKRADLTSKNQLDFANQFELMKADVAKLRGQIEVLVYELEAAQQRQKDFYVDLDNRLRKLESAAVAQAAKSEAPLQPDPANETRDYELALTAFKGAQYKEALAAFQGFIQNYPSSGLLASAYYWAASSFYQLKDYPHAAELFNHLANSWPNDAKAPDALLAAANAQLEGGDAKAGRKTLETLIEKYPASSTIPSAKARLKSLLPPPPKKK